VTSSRICTVADRVTDATADRSRITRIFTIRHVRCSGFVRVRP
jgi:hypothetical protein